MIKSRKIILSLGIALGIVSLVAWFVFGFNGLDATIDPVVPIVWVVLAVSVVQFIRSVESRRCMELRTCYVGEGIVFNFENGVKNFGHDTATADVVEDVVSNMNYGFDKAELTNGLKNRVGQVVRTFAYDKELDIWEGEVELLDRPELGSLRFDSKTSLAWALIGQKTVGESLEPELEVAQDTIWRTM